MSSSLEGGVGGVSVVSPSAEPIVFPNPFPNRPPLSFAGCSLVSSFAAGSGLNELWSLKGSEEPNTPVPAAAVPFWGGGKAVFVSVAWPNGLPAGLLPPNILDPPVVPDPDPREPNPPLFAKPAKPDDEDDVS